MDLKNVFDKIVELSEKDFKIGSYRIYREREGLTMYHVMVEKDDTYLVVDFVLFAEDNMIMDINISTLGEFLDFVNALQESQIL